MKIPSSLILDRIILEQDSPTKLIQHVCRFLLFFVLLIVPVNFRSLVAKKADVKSKIIGDANLNSSISPFYNDVPQNFPLVENIMDHIFSNLGYAFSCYSLFLLTSCNGNSIPNSVVLTEPVNVFTESRAAMCQLMFECYRVPSVNFGVDALFSYIYNAQYATCHHSENLFVGKIRCCTLTIRLSCALVSLPLMPW